MQTRQSKGTDIFANHFYENINDSLCKAFKQITSQDGHRDKINYSVIRILYFYIIPKVSLCFMVFSNVNYETC